MNEFDSVSSFELCNALQRAMHNHEYVVAFGNDVDFWKNAKYIQKLLAELGTRFATKNVDNE